MEQDFGQSFRNLIRQFSSDMLPEEDLVQESYLIYVKCIDKFDPSKGSFKSMFFISLKNEFISLYRKEIRRSRNRLDIQDFDGENELALVSDDWNPEEDIEWDDLIETIENQLDPGERLVFRVKLRKDGVSFSKLRKIMDMNKKDMDMMENNIKSIINKVLQQS